MYIYIYMVRRSSLAAPHPPAVMVSPPGVGRRLAGPVGGAGGRGGRPGRAVMAGRSDRWAGRRAGCRAVARTSGRMGARGRVAGGRTAEPAPYTRRHAFKGNL